MATPNNDQQLDIVFVLDCTGSMGPYIRSAEKSINDIVKAILDSDRLGKPEDLRVGILAYRDVDHFVEFLTKPCPLTSNINEVKDFLKRLGASGGGDGPEAVATALDKTLSDSMGWRPKTEAAQRIIVQVTDAPPHGIREPTGDKYPDGEPGTRGIFENIFQIKTIMKRENINYFVVSCGEMGRTYQRAVLFYRAQTSGVGYLIPLARSELLPKAIVGVALESFDLDYALEEMKKELEPRRTPFTSFLVMPAGATTSTKSADEMAMPMMRKMLLTIAEPESREAKELSPEELELIYANAQSAADIDAMTKAAEGNPEEAAKEAVKVVHSFFQKKGTKVRSVKTNIEYNMSEDAIHNLGIFENAKTVDDLVGLKDMPGGIPLTDAKQSVEIVEEPITEGQVERLASRYMTKYGSS